MLGWWFGCVCVCVCGQKLGENTGKKMQKIPQSRPPGLPWSTQHLKTVSDLAGIVLKMMKLIFQISKWEANLELQYYLVGGWVGGYLAYKCNMAVLKYLRCLEL